MFRPARKIRRWTVLLLLAVYGSVGVFGYGLHELWHVHHHNSQGHAGHTHGTRTAGHTSCCSSHGHCHSHDHSHSHAPASPRLASTAEGLQVSAVEAPCSICVLLSQAQQPSITISSGSLVTAAPTAPPADETLFPLHLPTEHLARGPPTC